MKNNGAVAATEYKLEWIDHLHELYGSFTRRNDLNEWIYFFRRPEFADPEESGKIAAEILRYIVTYGNISQKVVKYIEIVFHYADNRKKYEEMLGYGTMEYYCRYFLGSEEFPPYRLFEDCDPEKDYDGFLYTFHEIYYQIGSDELERYKRLLKSLELMISDILIQRCCTVSIMMYADNGRQPSTALTPWKRGIINICIWDSCFSPEKYMMWQKTVSPKP